VLGSLGSLGCRQAGLSGHQILPQAILKPEGWSPGTLQVRMGHAQVATARRQAWQSLAKNFTAISFGGVRI